MTANTRILNLTRGYTVKRNQALRAVENCAAVWVQFGVSIRDLNAAESIAARNEQARMREPLPFAECPGLVYRPAEKDQAATRHEYQLAREANQFASLQA